MSFSKRSLVVLVGLAVLCSLLLLPRNVNAIGVDADLRCVQSRCTMTPTRGRPLCPQVVCRDNTNGFSTVGFCATPTQCKAVSAGGQGVGLDQVAKILGDL